MTNNIFLSLIRAHGQKGDTRADTLPVIFFYAERSSCLQDFNQNWKKKKTRKFLVIFRNTKFYRNHLSGSRVVVCFVNGLRVKGLGLKTSYTVCAR